MKSNWYINWVTVGHFLGKLLRFRFYSHIVCMYEYVHFVQTIFVKTFSHATACTSISRQKSLVFFVWWWNEFVFLFTDYGVLWSTAVKKLSQFLEFQVYVDLFGREGAQRMFRRHVKKLKDDYLNSKVQRYFDVLPEVLHQLFPEFETFTEE